LGTGEVKREPGQAGEDAAGSAVALCGVAGHPAAFHGDQGELPGHEEGIDEEEERDESQTGGRTNREGPRRSREAKRITLPNLSYAGRTLCG
jgi:hypothetical protein